MSSSPTKSAPQTQARVPSPTPLALIDVANSSTLEALEASNNSIQTAMFNLRLNAQSLEEEVTVFESHYLELRNPNSETWEADILTRLIEIAHTIMGQKLGTDAAIHAGQGTDEREVVNRAYVEASKRISQATLRILGLEEDWYYEEVQRFPRVVGFRSPNPFATQVVFAQWIMEQKRTTIERYELWNRLFRVCYGRDIEQCASLPRRRSFNPSSVYTHSSG